MTDGSLNEVRSCCGYQFLSLESMYRIIDYTANMGSDANQIAIINIFEEFIGCAVSSLIDSSMCTF